MNQRSAGAPVRSRPPNLMFNAAAAVAYAASQTVVGLLLFSYLIRTLGAEQVGVWVSLIAVGMLACMADLALNHALVRAVPLAQQAGANHPPNDVIETLVCFASLFCGLSLLLLHLTFGWWSQFLSLPPAVQAQAATLLPYMTLGLWLNRLGDAFGGALEGFQHYVPRSLAGTAAFVLGLVLTLALVPSRGIEGAAAAFVLQNVFQCIANAWLLQQRSPGLRWWRPHLRREVLVEGVRYGLSIQMLVFCYLVIENGAKLLLVRGGFLAAVSYFDLAFRIGKGLRGLLSSALRVLVPKLTAQLHIEGQGSAIYANSFALVVAVAVPIYIGLLGGAQGLSWLVVGKYEPTFVAAVALGLFPWLAYCLIDPAINNAMATGRMQWALRGHLLKVVLAMALAAVPALQGSAEGLFAAVAMAMVVGSAVMLVAVHRLEGLPWRLLAPGPTLAVLASGLGVGLLGSLDDTPWSTRVGAMHAAGVAALFGLFVIALLRWHPGGQRLWGLVMGLLGKRGKELTA